MLKERICFSCAFWRAKQERPDPARIVVKGNMYYIGDEDPSVRPSWRGFGGSRFTIRILATGEEIISTNLWHNGDIPEHFLAVFPDTAEFL